MLLTRVFAFFVTLALLQAYVDTAAAECESDLLEAVRRTRSHAAAAGGQAGYGADATSADNPVDEAVEAMERLLVKSWGKVSERVTLMAQSKLSEVRKAQARRTQAQAQERGPDGLLCFEVGAAFWVRINSLSAIASYRLPDLAADLRPLFGEGVPAEGDGAEGPAAEAAEAARGAILQCARDVRRCAQQLLRRAVALVALPIREQLCSLLARFAAQQQRAARDGGATAAPGLEAVAQPTLEALDELLTPPHENLHASLARLVVRGVCESYMTALTDVLRGDAVGDKVAEHNGVLVLSSSSVSIKKMRSPPKSAHVFLLFPRPGRVV